MPTKVDQGLVFASENIQKATDSYVEMNATKKHCLYTAVKAPTKVLNEGASATINRPTTYFQRKVYITLELEVYEPFTHS